MGEGVVEHGIELLFVVALGGMVWSALKRWRAGHIVVPRCPACGHPTSRAYPRCRSCGAWVGDS